MKAKSPKSEEIEFHPDAWERFEKFVKQIAKAGPQHRPTKKPADGVLEGKPKRGRPKKGSG
jgi:hypothetical protein